MKSKKIVHLAEIGILTAIIIVMAFTPLGYLRLPFLPALEISLLPIPVIIGAIVIGPTAGTILGGIFGLTSFFQAFGMSAFGVMMFQISPLNTFIVAFFPRLIMGLLIGLIFKAFKNKGFLSFGVSAMAGPVLNTILFMTALMLLFGNAPLISEMRGEMSILPFMVAFVGINALVELVVCTILGAIVSKAVCKLNSSKF